MIQRALIVGGGPAGMSAAIALASQGVECEIVELDPVWEPAGIGIGLQSPPLRALKSLDLFAPLVERSWHHQAIDMLAVDGSPIGVLPQVNVNDADDPPFITMPRATLHEVLEKRLRDLGVRVRLATTVESLAQDAAGVDTVLTDGAAGRWDLVVGADGLHSKLRGMALPAAPAPEYAGQVIWRIGARRPAGLERYTMMIAGPTRIGLVPLSDDDVYLWMLDSTLPPERPAGDRLLELFAERLGAYGFVVPEILEQVTDASQVDFRALHWLLVPPPWHAGRVLLIGDAAHTTTPHLAFGVGLAFEDVVVLSELVAAGIEADDLGARLVERRFERARLVVENSLQLSRWEQDPDTPRELAGRLIGETLGRLAEPI